MWTRSSTCCAPSRRHHPHVGPIDPLRDIGNVEIELIVSDLSQIENGWSAWPGT